jgi:hypothetical protein
MCYHYLRIYIKNSILTKDWFAPLSVAALMWLWLALRFLSRNYYEYHLKH